jgi:hypothetical protein
MTRDACMARRYRCLDTESVMSCTGEPTMAHANRDDFLPYLSDVIGMKGEVSVFVLAVPCLCMVHGRRSFGLQPYLAYAICMEGEVSATLPYLSNASARKEKFRQKSSRNATAVRS